jgi:hypothetical protein
MRCTICNTVIPHHARYCSKCGLRVTLGGQPAQAPMARNAHPSRAPIPRAGKAFIVMGIVGMVLLGLGISDGVSLFTMAGVAILSLLAIILFAGDHIFS